MSSGYFNGHSMVTELCRVMVCSPGSAGWGAPGRACCWRELGFQHSPDFTTARTQHESLCRQLGAAGVEVTYLPPSPAFSLDAIYTHDPSFVTDYGLVVLNPGKPNRVAEARQHREFCRNLGIPVFGEIQSPGVVEAGDMLWLDSHTLLVGHGYRTNASGMAKLRALLSAKDVEVISAPLPHGLGPSACLHLMSLISLLDEETALVDLSWLSVETVELLRARGYRFIEIDPAERHTLACNVLSLGRKRLLALEENRATNQKLRDAGFDVRTFLGSEIGINGGGGPTCLTRPLLRT